MNNLSRRLERIEELLSNEPRPGEMSPVLQEAVDRIIQRLSKTCNASEDSEGGKDVE